MSDLPILKSIQRALIDHQIESLEDLRPHLLINDHTQGTKILSHIIKELESCHEFFFSVAFITESGITPLLNILKQLERKNIPGKILTTNYLTFTEPKALKRLLTFKNIELRMYTKGNFHAKGYIFLKDQENTLVVGSANLTQQALTQNQEWSIRVSSLDEGKLLKDTLAEFHRLWYDADIINYNYIEKYEEQYNRVERPVIKPFVPSHKEIKPNKMQRGALKALKALRERGETKGLLISATGTGKTYLSAFDVKAFNPKKFLFIVHRENIARTALESYRNVIGEKKYGILSGTRKDYDADYLFAMIQTISQDEQLYQFSPDHFDYIVIDEVHRSGAQSYIKVLNHFKPQFLLGMTATPERTDGFNIYQHFDYNIAYEIRLKDALEADLLAPFHYFGVTEIEVDGEILDDYADFNRLTSDERVRHIIETIEFYGYHGTRPRGLIFCSRIEEAEILSEKFNHYGYRTVALSGKHSETEREEAIQRLETDDEEFKLDYIFTVDIFNEGIDIPSVNQIVMLRPTQSAIIFVQQLGRGLRKSPKKDYVTVIDFIGNYQNNYLIPVALSGDRTYNKDTLRHFLYEGNNIIPGSSTISFDEISKERIYETINQTNFKRLSFLKEKYFKLKNKVGKIPQFIDFYKYGEIEPTLITNHSKTYFDFLKKVEKDIVFNINSDEYNIILFMSQELMLSKRPHEVVILRELLKHGMIDVSTIETILEAKYGIVNDTESIISAFNYISLKFLTSAERKKYTPFVNTDNQSMTIKQSLVKSYKHNEDFRFFIDGMIDYCLNVYEQEYLPGKTEESNLILYKKYTRKDVSLLLNFEENRAGTLMGYRIVGNYCPIFVTYKKSDDISETTKYDDKFMNKNTFSWMTRSRIRMTSKEAASILNAEALGIKLLLFIKKADDEGIEHYYMGEVTPISAKETTITDEKGNELPIVNFIFKVNPPVRDDIYDYITT